MFRGFFNVKIDYDCADVKLSTCNEPTWWLTEESDKRHLEKDFSERNICSQEVHVVGRWFIEIIILEPSNVYLKRNVRKIDVISAVQIIKFCSV